MKVIICDDDISDINFICPIIKNFFAFYDIPISIDICITGADLLNHFDFYHLLIMDIQLKEENGMDIVKQFHNKHLNTKVLYFSSNINYAYQTYNAYGDGFIKKPIDVDNLYNELHRVLNAFKMNQLIIPEIHGVNLLVDKSKIIYIKSNKRYSIIIMTNSELESNRSISEWEKYLSSDEAFQLCRRGNLVNLYAVDSVDMYGKVHLSNGKTLRLSDRIRKSFIDKYIKFWSDNL